jgi:hypothetical protein
VLMAYTLYRYKMLDFVHVAAESDSIRHSFGSGYIVPLILLLLLLLLLRGELLL